MIADQFLTDTMKMIPGQEERWFSNAKDALQYHKLNDALRDYDAIRTIAISTPEDCDLYQAVCCRTLSAINAHFLKGLMLTDLDRDVRKTSSSF